jgi:hypothetical protein
LKTRLLAVPTALRRGGEVAENYPSELSDALAVHKYLEWTRRWIAACVPLLTEDGSLWVMINDRWAGHV